MRNYGLHIFRGFFHTALFFLNINIMFFLIFSRLCYAQEIAGALPGGNESAAIVQDKIDLKKELTKTRDENIRLSKQLKELKANLNIVNQEKDKYLTAQQKIEKEFKAAERKFTAVKDENLKLSRDIKRLFINDDKVRQKEREYALQSSELRKKIEDITRKLSDANRTIKKFKIETGDVHYNLGVIFQNTHKYDLAIKEYERILELNPDDVEVSYNIALIYDTIKNNREKAKYYYNRYLLLAPLAKDAARVKKHIIDIDLENRVWGDPDIKNIGQKEKLGRW